MINTKESIKRAVVGVFLFVWLSPVTGCTAEVERRWTEEVELENGQVIAVGRYVKFVESNSLAGDAYSAVELESKLSFSEDLADVPSWSVPLQPLLLYRDSVTHEWTIVATAGSCDAWYARGSPRPPYWEFRLRGNTWKEVPLSPTSMNRRSNLFFLYERPLTSSRLTREAKRGTLSNADIAPMYLSVTHDATWGCTAPAR